MPWPEAQRRAIFLDTKRRKGESAAKALMHRHGYGESSMPRYKNKKMPRYKGPSRGRPMKDIEKMMSPVRRPGRIRRPYA